MSLSTLSIKRPVLTIVMNIAIVLFGIIGFTYLGVREFPSIDPAQISVRTNYTGANADIIESQITEPLEKAINSIDGIRNITSSSNQGSSNINIEFNLDKNLEEAANDVRDKVSQAVRSLPQDIDSAIEKYYGDNGKYPDGLDLLVSKKYLRSLPLDPITASSTSGEPMDRTA